MSLFGRLINLNTGNIRLEDSFTEIVAYLFSINKEILYAWLEYSNLLDTSTCLDAYISTQRSFDAFDLHSASSCLDIVIELVHEPALHSTNPATKKRRPDIVIELVHETHRDIIFIESKIDSQEGNCQLSSYANILHHKFSDFRSKTLVYITRDFEPKNESNIFKEISNNTVQFKQLRWHQFHRFLESHLDKFFVQEIVEFMQENNMAHNNQFSSIDVLALTNFTKSLKIIEQTMSGKKRAWWCGLGFHDLITSNITDYPTVRLMLEVPPNSDCRAEIIPAMNDISSQLGWQGYGLNEQRAWSGIILEKSLRDFLSQEDHVTAIEEFFLEALNKLAEIKKKYSQLPWTAITETEETSEDE